jgi:hypothetical protein
MIFMVPGRCCRLEGYVIHKDKSTEAFESRFDSSSVGLGVFCTSLTFGLSTTL